MSGSNVSVGTSGKELPNLLGDLYAAATINTGAGTSPQLLVTGAPGYYITRLFVEVDPTCTIAAGGMVTFTFTDTGSGQVIGAARAYIPAVLAAPLIPTVAQSIASGAGYFYRSLSVGSTLTVTSSVALTAGSVRCAVNGGTTPFNS